MFLKQLKKEQDEYTAQVQHLQEQIAKMELNSRKIREKIQNEENTARLN